ncbi:MAG: GAF domain-containing protein [Anaerolineae bacterium]|nr:GAF domain-containing protein [Anaerolineae bacterium]
MTTKPEKFVTNLTANHGTHTILIVDDNRDNLAVLSYYLNTYGFRVLVARNGESALQKALYVKPDIILLDVLMPGIDGFETCQRLKENRHTRDIPVIFMTALTEAGDKVRGFQVGGVDYITKPLQHEEVLARVRTHLSIRDLTHNLQDQANQLQRMNTDLVKRTIQLETSSQLGQQVTSILDLDELMARVVELIQFKFNYYFVSIWLIEEQQGAVILRAGAGLDKNSPLSPGSQLSIEDTKYAVVWVSQSGNAYLTNATDKTKKLLAPHAFPKAQSELTLPLKIGQESIGVLDILSNRFSEFVEEDIVVLQTLADQIAIAIRNAEFYKVEQRRRRLAESLEYTGRVLSGTLDIRHVPGRILDEVANVVPYERGLLLLHRGDTLQSVAQRGFPDHETTLPLSISIRSGDIFKRITKLRRPLLINDVTKDSGWRQLEWLPINHSWLGVPLIAKSKVIGMMSLTREMINAFSLDDVTVALAFAGQAAIVLENAGLYDEISQLNEDLERKVAQRTEELKKAYKTLEQLDQTKTDFINVTSHELRTPLSVIKGYTQILAILPPVSKNEKAKELLGGINAGVNRLHQIVNTMLDVVRIDAEVLRPHYERITIEEKIHEINQQFTAALQERNLSVNVYNLKNLPTIHADPDLLDKVFYNLIVNAIKYTPDGGTITITGKTTQLNEQPAVELIISDSGIGIDPEHHDQIFKKFYQTGEVSLHSSGETKFKGGGPGLGLAIVHGIMQAHRGQVWVESEKHDEETYPGSHFHVVLPVNQLA